MTDTTSDLARRSLRESKKTSPVRGKLIDYSKSPMASGMEKTTSPNRSKSESQNLHLFDSAEETEENESDTTESSLEQEMTDSSFAPANEVIFIRCV